MKFNERKGTLLAIKENIEMILFSSEELCVVTSTLEKETLGFEKRHLEHPLTFDFEEKPEPEIQSRLRLQAEPETESTAKEEAERIPPVPGLVEKLEIEMEEFPPPRTSEHELPVMSSEGSSAMALPSTSKVSHVKWKRLTLQKTGLLVRDVLCLPQGHYLAQLERHSIPRGKERAALSSMGMVARITIDGGWSANQMESRLAVLFQRHFVQRAGERFSFTYLQCVQGSRVLYVPDTPAEGWTGSQVLRISGHSALYILSQHDYAQEIVLSGGLCRELPGLGRVHRASPTSAVQHMSTAS